jgi:hypothetical protein
MTTATGNSRVVTLDAPTKSQTARSPLSLGWRRFLAHRMAIVGALILLAIVLYILVG